MICLILISWLLTDELILRDITPKRNQTSVTSFTTKLKTTAYLRKDDQTFLSELQLQSAQNTTFDVRDVHRFCLDRRYLDKSAIVFCEKQVIGLDGGLEALLVGRGPEFLVGCGFEESHICYLQNDKMWIPFFTTSKYHCCIISLGETNMLFAD